jgi:competence ComEA-like helix-hairpin-helix protein
MKLPALFIALLTLSFAACQQANQSSPPLSQTPVIQSPTNRNPSSDCVNLNKAGAEELKALQGVGEAMAQKILAYRKQRGGFRRPQELIIIEGFSEKKYRAIAELVCVE